MARAADAGTACYSGDSDILRGLAWLRRAGGFLRPLATILHSLPTKPAETAWTNGVDLAICLSRRTQQ